MYVHIENVYIHFLLLYYIYQRQLLNYNVTYYSFSIFYRFISLYIIQRFLRYSENLIVKNT